MEQTQLLFAAGYIAGFLALGVFVDYLLGDTQASTPPGPHALTPAEVADRLIRELEAEQWQPKTPN
jgi:hypothetical protein